MTRISATDAPSSRPDLDKGLGLAGKLQFATVRNLIMAWVLMLPVAILLSGSLYFVFSQHS